MARRAAHRSYDLSLGKRMGDRAAMRATELGEAEFVLQRAALASPAAKERLGISTARMGGGIVSVMATI